MAQQAGSKTNTKRPGAGRVIWTIVKFALLIVLGMGIAGGAWAAKFSYDAWKDLPPFDKLDLSQTSIVYDRNGKELYKLHGEENRTFIESKDIPQVMQDAIVAIEDYRFYEHPGVDVWRIAGAATNNLRAMLHLGGSRGLQGASTLTQQLARNTWLSQKQTLYRKVQEAEIAIQIERRFTKQEILKMYLNEVYYGEGAYGLQAAAHTFFGKDAKQLTLAEAALLAGLVQSPSGYDPFIAENREDAINRRNTVLGEMLKHNYIDQHQYDQAKSTPLELATVKPEKGEETRNQYDFVGASFVDYVIRMITEPDVAKKHGISPISEEDLLRAGYKIYTTLDPDTQKILDKAIDEQMNASDKDPEYTRIEKQNSPDLSIRPEAAGVVMDPKTGEVLALAGGRKHEGMRTLNRATDTYRQPGSAIKPLVAYGPAIQDLGWGPQTVVDDSPPSLIYPNQDKVWPYDYELFSGGRYEGLVSVAYALGDSRNAPAVRTIEAVGVKQALRYGQAFGLTTLDPAADGNSSLALGGITKGVSVLDMTAAYSTIANMGLHIDPVIVTKIVDANGQVVYQAEPERRPVLRPVSDYLLVETMKNTLTWGTGSFYTKQDNKTFPYPAAGKTGTTEIGQDAWFLGFTTNRVLGIWTGYDQQKHLPWTGAFVPVQIWNQAMRDMLAKTGAPPDWVKPQGIVSVEVCARTGLLPTTLCPTKVTGMWERGKEPVQQDNVLVNAQAVQEPLKDKAGKPVLAGGKPVLHWVLWQNGCLGQPQTRLFIRRPNAYARDPKDPWDERFLPKDYTDEVPTTRCTPQPGPPTGENGGGSPGTGGIFPPGFVPPVLGPDGSGGTGGNPGTTPAPGSTGTPPTSGGTPGTTGGGH